MFLFCYLSDVYVCFVWFLKVDLVRVAKKLVELITLIKTM